MIFFITGDQLFSMAQLIMVSIVLLAVMLLVIAAVAILVRPCCQQRRATATPVQAVGTGSYALVGTRFNVVWRPRDLV